LLLKGQEFVFQSAVLKMIEGVINISPKLIKHFVKCWWQTEGILKQAKQVHFLRQNHGVMMRGDHTYKAVKGLAGWDENNQTWVCICCM
jgi:hypothetical protein